MPHGVDVGQSGAGTQGGAGRVEVSGEVDGRGREILTEEALAFVAELQARFGARREELLALRSERRAQVARTGRLDFLRETRHIRAEPSWRVNLAPRDLVDRRVEITGPTDPKMAVNALNSGAQAWLADLEDANTPHWNNVVTGQVVLADAVRRRLAYTSPDGREYRLGDGRLATIVVRPRGWHLTERHVTVDGEPAAAALVDFGLYFFHNAHELLGRGSGPYFYLPKLESHLEARLWADVFAYAEQRLGIRRGRVRATVLIETIPAAFEMEEILYELRQYAAGLNAGRWDYLFSIIKYFRDAGPDFVLPDRNAVTMTAPFMRAYTELLVRTCHKRGAFAIGGMAAFVPSRRDSSVNETAFERVRADKEREAKDGFDGSWVAHPDLVPLCNEMFDVRLGAHRNQLSQLREDVHVTADDLLDLASTPGAVTLRGLRNNVAVALRYLTAWLGGTGAVAIFNLMEDAATAEIARSQLWQWIHNRTELDTGEKVTAELVGDVMAKEYERLRAEAGAGAEDHLDAARKLLERVVLGEEFADFLTVPAYDLIDGTP
ncbi:malate synthase A [Actinopolymorpha rutila]|uniref:Malate synthase n=1 Tax=Actinopolymorpha rutila TaxID=446787 RepID=A0A852ZVH3_9ACTN|nr:malate synthase [Actinopolymorpha rutila]